MTRNPWLTRRSALKTGAIAAGVAGVGTRSGVAQDDEPSPDAHCYYQIDFVAGDPIETLGVSDDDFYGRQNRLVQYVHVDGDDVIERDTWINSLAPEIRRCVIAEPIRIREGTASVEFTVADGCEGRSRSRCTRFRAASSRLTVSRNLPPRRRTRSVRERTN